MEWNELLFFLSQEKSTWKKIYNGKCGQRHRERERERERKRERERENDRETDRQNNRKQFLGQLNYIDQK